MKRQYLIIGIVGMLIAGGLSGCIEQQQSSKTESLTADDNNSTVELNVGNTVNLTLEQNSASTGYVWNITELNESVLTLDRGYL